MNTSTAPLVIGGVDSCINSALLDSCGTVRKLMTALDSSMDMERSLAGRKAMNAAGTILQVLAAAVSHIDHIIWPESDLDRAQGAINAIALLNIASERAGFGRNALVEAAEEARAEAANIDAIDDPAEWGELSGALKAASDLAAAVNKAMAIEAEVNRVTGPVVKALAVVALAACAEINGRLNPDA
jgi:hypothetical protein